MKQLLLAVSLATLAMGANANGYGYQPSAQQGQAQGQAQGQLQGQAQQAMGGGGGNSSTSVNVDNDTDMPASSANSPSVGTANTCQIATPSSKAFSVLIFSVSGTTGVNYNDICFALELGQTAVAEKLMCQKSQAYAAANPNCAAE